jgi:hypothetical protein
MATHGAAFPRGPQPIEVDGHLPRRLFGSIQRDGGLIPAPRRLGSHRDGLPIDRDAERIFAVRQNFPDAFRGPGLDFQRRKEAFV